MKPVQEEKNQDQKGFDLDTINNLNRERPVKRPYSQSEYKTILRVR